MRPSIQIVVLILVSLTPAAPLWAQGDASTRVRALLVIDTHAENLGDYPRIVGEKMKNLLRDGFQGHRNLLTIDVIEGRAATPQSVLNYYRLLQSSPDETLLFYYFGHGAIDPRSQEHYLAMRYGTLFRSELRDVMQAKRPRLCVLLTGCCSSYVPASRIPAPRGPRNFNIAPLDTPPSWESISNLFLHPRGLVDITAASPGTVALSGLFTDAMIETLDYPRRYVDLNRDGFLTWKEFLAHVSQRTNSKYVSHRPYSQYEIVRSQANQIPYAFALPESNTPPRTPRPPVPRGEPKTYVVTVLENPYNVTLRYHYRWGEAGQWTSAVLQPRTSLAHHMVYNPANCPFLNIQYDSVWGDNAATVAGYRLEGYLSQKTTQGKQYRFFTRGQSVLDLGYTN